MFAMKCCPPAHKLSPDDIIELRIIHHDNISPEEYELIAHTLENMSQLDYEYSRSLISFALEHIIETLHGIYHNIDALKIATSPVLSFQQNFKRINDSIEKILPKNTIKVKQVKELVFWMELHCEGVQLLEDICKNKQDSDFLSLLNEERVKNKNYAKELFVRQKALHTLDSDYVIITLEEINGKARENISKFLGMRYDNLGYRLLDRLNIDGHFKMFLWSVTANEEKRLESIQNKSYQELEEEDYIVFKKNLPNVIREYSQIFNPSFTNNMNIMACVANFRAEFLTTERPWIKSVRMKHFKYDMEFADKLMLGASKIKEILYNSSQISTQDNCIVIYKDKNIDKVIAKLNGSSNSIIFYEELEQTFGCLISNEDLKNNKIISFEEALSKSKGSSFHGMTHFMVEIKDDWVQNYYFDNIREALPVHDMRELSDIKDSRHLFEEDYEEDNEEESLDL